MPKTANEIFAEKVNHLVASEKRLDKAVIAHQRKLYELIVSEYLPRFKLADGVIIDSPANDALLREVDNLFSKLEKTMYRDVIGTFAADLLKSAEISAEYYVGGLGFKKGVVDSLLADKVRLENRIGMTPSGRLRRDGYLYKLGQTPQVRQDLLNYVTKSLTGDVSFLDFQLGMRNLVIGNRRQKGLAVDGRLKKYFDQYAYDTFNQMDAVANKQLATNLNLEHFIYEGSLIDTSRKFCEKRAGKAFSIAEAQKWKNDPDLIDKKTKDSYRPLIDRGRYRCRHFLKYITKELYDELKGREAATKPPPTPTPPGGKPATKTTAPPKPKKKQTKQELAISEATKTLKKYNPDLILDKEFMKLYDERVTIDISDAKQGGAYYSPATKVVRLPKNKQRGAYHAKSVVYHELSHSIHMNKQLITASVIDERIAKDIAALKKKHKKSFADFDDTEIYFKRVKDFKTEAERQDFRNMLGVMADTVAAFTKGRKGQGHAKSYWRGNFPAMEIFAHGASMRYVPNPIFKEYLPDLQKDVIALVKKYYDAE